MNSARNQPRQDTLTEAQQRCRQRLNDPDEEALLRFRKSQEKRVERYKQYMKEQTERQASQIFEYLRKGQHFKSETQKYH